MLQQFHTALQYSTQVLHNIHKQLWKQKEKLYTPHKTLQTNTLQSFQTLQKYVTNVWNTFSNKISIFKTCLQSFTQIGHFV